MSYASQQGRARISSRRPEAAAQCDRCGFIYNHVDLRYQFEWRGAALQNIRILVCKSCRDLPQEQLRAIVLPADPTPIINARPQDFTSAETDYRAASAPLVTDPVTGIPVPSTTLRTTQDCQNRTTEPYGDPDGLTENAVMPVAGAQVAYGSPLPVASVIGFGNTTVQVTCWQTHGLQTGATVAVEGLTVNVACGFFTVTVISATAFTYHTMQAVPSGWILTPSTQIVPAAVGVPLGYAQLPSGGPIG